MAEGGGEGVFCIFVETLIFIRPKTARFFGYLGGNMMSESLGARNFGGNHKFIFNLFLLEIQRFLRISMNMDFGKSEKYL
ncbi:unnamed protein product [Rhizophagus irregularis]|nr:unnamed protein product [Rhizophagus irregularis]